MCCLGGVSEDPAKVLSPQGGQKKAGLLPKAKVSLKNKSVHETLIERTS